MTIAKKHCCFPRPKPIDRIAPCVSLPLFFFVTMASPKLSADETRELQRLLAKAKAAAAPSEGPGGSSCAFPIYDQITGRVFDPVSGASHDVWDESSSWDDIDETFTGGMSDAAKRHDMDSGNRLESASKRVTTVGGQQCSAHMPNYMSQGSVATPYPSTAKLGEDSKSPGLPEGVGSLHEWGRTVIQFVMFEKDNMSYEDLALSQEERKIQYVKWILSRRSSAKGLLKDLCEYLTMLEAEKEINGGPIIPGTSQRRRMKQ